MAGATRHEPKPTGADVNNNPATGSDKRAPAAGESGTMRTEGRLDSADKTGTAKPGESGTMRTEGRPDSADKIGTAKTGPRAELPGDKVGQAPSTSPRTDAPTGKASTPPVDQTKLPTTKQPSPVGQPAPDFPVVLPPRFTPFNLGIMGNTRKPEPGACDRKGADVKTGNGLTQPGTAGGPTIKEGLVQSGRTGNPADASGKVVQSGRGERNEGMVQPGRTISTSDTSGKAVKPGRSDRNEGLVQPGSTDNTSDGSGKIAKPGRSERNEGMVQSGRTGNTADAAGKVVRPGRNDRHEGMTQSDRTGQTAGSSGNVVKAVRSEPNDGRAETATRAIEQIHSGNRQSESRAGQEEKPTPAKDRRVEQNTTMSDVQLQGLAVRLFGDLQAKLSSFVQSIKDSARRAQPDQAAPNEIAGEQRNVSMLPKPSDIRLKGPGAPAESTTAYTYARPADKDATDALIAFVKANRSLLDGVLEPNAGTNELLKELVKLVQEIDCGDAEQNMPDADADVPCFDLTVESDASPTSAGRAWYIVRAGETLDSIAEDLFNDARISYVLYEINKAKLPATITDGAITRDLIPGTVLYLPTASEIHRFLAFYSNARAS